MANSPTQKVPAGKRIVDSIRPKSGVRTGRRQFFIASSGVLGAGTVGLFSNISIVNPNLGKAVEASGPPIDVDLSWMEPGHWLLVERKKRLVQLLNHEGWMLDTLAEPLPLQRLQGPPSRQNQQPAQEDESSWPRDGILFRLYYTAKGLFGVSVFSVVFFWFVFYRPDSCGFLLVKLNDLPANIPHTPFDIHPLRFFFPFYAMPRAL